VTCSRRPAAGGWPHSLTEDCALGVKLCTEFGAKVATAYSPELTTKEEVPPSIFNREIGSLFWQRDRWVRGFIGEFISGSASVAGQRQKSIVLKL